MTREPEETPERRYVRWLCFATTPFVGKQPAPTDAEVWGPKDETGLAKEAR